MNQVDNTTRIFNDNIFGSFALKEEDVKQTMTFSAEQEIFPKKAYDILLLQNQGSDIKWSELICPEYASIFKHKDFLSRLYGNYLIFAEADGSTLTSSNKSHAKDEFRQLLRIASQELKQEDYDDFSLKEKFTSWIEKYNFDAIGTILDSYKLRQIEENILSKILETLGRVNDANSYRERILLLEYFLQDESPVIRYGAITGISNLEDVELLPSIDKALNEENAPLLIGLLRSVKEHLK